MVHFDGVWATARNVGLHGTGRPLQGLYFGVVFGVLGTHPVLHALLLGVLNATTAVLLWAVVRRLFTARMAMLSTLAWVVVANRSTSHYWFSAGPILFAACLLLVGVLLLSHNRPWSAAVVLGAGVLTYEGVAVLATMAVAVWVWHAYRDRWLRGVGMSALLLAAAGFDWMHSPKTGGASNYFGHAHNWISTLFGAGIFATHVGVVAASSVVLISLAFALARAVVPGFKTDSAQRALLFGTAIAIGGLLPFLAVGFPAATDGLFDRGNVVADLGIALVLGAIAAFAAPYVPRMIRTSVVAVAVVALGWPGIQSLKNYVNAAANGRQLQAAFASDRPRLDRPLVVGPPPDYPGGVGVFVTTWDMSGYLQLIHDDASIRARMSCTAADFADAGEATVFNRLTGSVVERPSMVFGSAVCRRLGL